MYHGFSDSAVALSSRLLDPLVDAHHVVDVRAFLPLDFLLRRFRGKPRLLFFRQFGVGQCPSAALRLPARLQLRGPFLVGRPVVAHVDRRRRALKYIEFFRVCAEIRHRLNGGRARADDADDLVLQVRQIRAGVFVVPTRRVERMALERLHARDARQFWFRQRAVCADHELRAHVIAAVGVDVPHLLRFVPHGRRHRRLEHREFVEVVTPRDRLAVREDLRPARVVVLRHVTHFVEQRQIVVRDDVARGARITVPVPRAADVAAAFDDTNALDAFFAQPRRRQQRGKSAADEQHFHRVADRIARFDLAAVRIGCVLREFSRKLRRELLCSFRSILQPQVALLREFAFDLVVVGVRVSRSGHRVHPPRSGKLSAAISAASVFRDCAASRRFRRARRPAARAVRADRPA